VRATCDELPIELEAPGILRAATEWGGLRVSLERLSAVALRPHGAITRCTCPHWGYLRAGRLRVGYPDHDELISAGDLYYAAPGHVLVVEADSDIVELSPAEAWTRAASRLPAGSGKCALQRGREDRSNDNTEGDGNAH